jgi:hypothetical protein
MRNAYLGRSGSGCAPLSHLSICAIFAGTEGEARVLARRKVERHLFQAKTANKQFERDLLHRHQVALRGASHPVKS